MELLYLLGISFVIIFIALFIIGTYLTNPFKYPYIVICFDISGKRQPVYEDYVDEWIIGLSNPRQEIIDMYNRTLNEWNAACQYYLKHCVLWKSRRKEFYKNMKKEVSRKDYAMYKFIFTRKQTRYRQYNYQKHSYTISNTDNLLLFSLKDMLCVNHELENINYETTRTKWYSNNQRRLMTKELKEKIKKRDNYTCQMCGKYMPDEVGLHIDHIIPVKMGGKSIESNLQVLCDKCNLSKGKKII